MQWKIVCAVLTTLSASACGTSGGVNPAYMHMLECGQWRAIDLPQHLPEALDGIEPARTEYLRLEGAVIAHNEYGEERKCWTSASTTTPQD